MFVSTRVSGFLIEAGGSNDLGPTGSASGDLGGVGYFNLVL